MISCAVVETNAEFESLTDDWWTLLGDSVDNEPTLSPLWLKSWWSTFGALDDRALKACAFRDGVRLVGLAPLLARPVRYYRVLPFRRIELMASGEDESEEIASDYLSVVVAQGYESAVAAALVDALVGCALGAWDELVFPRMSSESVMIGALREALERRCVATRLVTDATCRYVSLPHTWNLYLKCLPSRHRYVVRRALRELGEWDAGWSLTRVANADQLVMGTENLIRLHQERWQADGRQGVFASRRFRAFHEMVMPGLLKRNALDLSWLTARGEVIAVSYGILWNRKVHFYQSGRKMDVPSNLKPGIALHALSIKRAIEGGFLEYDFLAGEARYKEQMATGSRDLLELRAMRPGLLRETARRALERGVDLVKSFRGKTVKRWRGS